MLYVITLKEGASDEELSRAKEQATSEGGTIKHEYSLIKGFTVEYPDDHVSVLKGNNHINVEQDAEFTTQ